ncbi:MAG: methionyl-tRNA formyltransferase [Bacteroidetes bacterium GWF2_42_66]|nr:MAG: methionyl-tRNA formyltransferase [Bacteroidetes bacterium GWA2_42_15]OFY00180.1 MAG: methionyl-tRNA formyltransferase [Bacteroidetes bacterium GWE2_42_39]OFY40321.1 MAG: methionyl-tRNA formyltransferase [Bacteroidetes bacterium GWF2_42_66]HBL73693.1 methionyl-tRNA formyltransferase [Prolixibacteraceae bacterium]HCR90703.1 methionyl-tRNA formyltransferase [Prolixibacteraceae bacterium]
MQGKDLRIVFMGTPDFAVASLKALVESGYQVAGVITAPDKPAGRGQKLNESAVKQYAAAKGLKIFQPEKLKNPDFIDDLKSLNADLQIVVAFRMLPEIVWNMPRLGTFNLHGSLLPQYRGAAPLNWAIINGEKETGVTTFLLDQEIDTGKILFREKITINKDDTVGSIHDCLMEIGAELVLKTVDALAKGNFYAIHQDELAATTELKHAPKIFKDDCRIDWSMPGEKIRNLIRGLSPYPTAWTELIDENGQAQVMKIYFADFADGKTAESGTISSDEKTFLNVKTADGWLNITDLQLAGKKRMNVVDFLRGFHGIEKMKLK